MFIVIMVLGLLGFALYLLGKIKKRILVLSGALFFRASFMAPLGSANDSLFMWVVRIIGVLFFILGLIPPNKKLQ